MKETIQIKAKFYSLQLDKITKFLTVKCLVM